MGVALEISSGRSLQGLTSAEAARRLAEFGPNLLVKHRRGERVLEWLRALLDPMALMLAAAGSVYLALGERTEGYVLLAALVPVLAVDVIFEVRSSAAVRKLARAVAPRARVIRDGGEAEIATEDIVEGDLVLLGEGDIVHADAAVLSAFNLAVDEAQLTGESEPQSKSPAAAGEGANVYAGSRVLAGHGVAQVAATGARTRFGNIARMVAEPGFELTPLQRKTARMVRRIVQAAIAASVLVFLLLRWRGAPVGDAFLYAITLAMAAVGEEFALVLTLFLALGSFRLGRIGVLVRHLASVETLGSTTVICLDKTGTLTAGTYELVSHAPIGPEMGEAELLEAAALACEPNPDDSIERTIVAHCAEHGVDIARLHEQWKLVHDYDFDAIGKHMSHVWKRADGRAGRIVAKGALEGILEHCAADDATRERAHRANAELAGQGMRVLAVAGRGADADGFSGVRDTDESNLRLYGLLGFQDPVRPDVPPAVAECQRAGIQLKLITGDHALTAHAIADATGLAHESDGIITGPELDRLDAADFAATVRRKTIIARVRPEQKFAIVDALMKAGEIVAMTGDGINDAPALRHAHIGVSMGRRGTEVARAAADIVLLDDDFASLVATIREGRRLFGNLEQAFRYLIGFKVMLVAMAMGAPVLGLPILLTPIDVVWLELIVHPVSALVFEGREPVRDVMSQPPLDPMRPILAGRSGFIPAIAGALLASAAIGMFVALLGDGEGSARSAAMVIAVLGSLLLVWAELAGAEPWWKVTLPRDLRFWTIVAAVAASLPILISVPALAQVLSVAPISAATWLKAALLALAAVGWRAPGWHRGRA